MASGTLSTTLLFGWASMARLGRRSGRRGVNGNAWVAKADVEGHVQFSIFGVQV